jgi:hypothetical protein
VGLCYATGETGICGNLVILPRSSAGVATASVQSPNADVPECHYSARSNTTYRPATRF